MKRLRLNEARRVVVIARPNAKLSSGPLRIMDISAYFLSLNCTTWFRHLHLAFTELSSLAVWFSAFLVIVWYFDKLAKFEAEQV